MQLGVYIHIPFCLKKCSYCDFNSYPNKQHLVDDYIASVLKEISNLKSQISNRISTIYFGGGTPSLVHPEYICKLISVLTDKPDKIEITLEANPGTIDLDKLKQYKQAGINRISLGIQSFDETVLKSMGRVHRVSDNIAGFQAAREAGFDNLSLDLIFGYPSQTIESWKETVKQIIAWRPEHISSYGLTIEPETRLYQEIQLRKVVPLEEEIELEMYQYAIQQFKQAGYIHYEISNFARPGRECRHNLNYWNDTDYLGFGAGAHSYWDGERFWNLDSPEEYIQKIQSGQSPRMGSERLEGKRKMAEYAMLSLRTMQGLELNKFHQKFQQEFIEIFKTELLPLFDSGLLEQDTQFIRLTDKGILLSNEVFSNLF
ncbi:MAG: radical SAM family heme chaperone HemW [bacterium]